MPQSPLEQSATRNGPHRRALATVIRILNRAPTNGLPHSDAPDLLSQCLLQLTDIGLLTWSTTKRAQLQELAS